MARHPAIARVHYPLPGMRWLKPQMQGFGGMLSVEVRGGRAATARRRPFVRSRGAQPRRHREPGHAALYHPHHGLSPARARRGIPDAMLRFSVGLEDVADLIAVTWNEVLR